MSNVVDRVNSSKSAIDYIIQCIECGDDDNALIAIKPLIDNSHEEFVKIIDIINSRQNISTRLKILFYQKMQGHGIHYPDLYYHLGMLSVSLGLKDQAKAYFEYNLIHHPEHIPSCLEYASCLIEMGYMDKAIGILLTLYQNGCEQPKLIANLAIAYMFLKKSKLADFFLRKIPSNDPGLLVSSLLKLANHFSMKSMFEDAERIYIKLEQAYPDCYDIYNAHARMLLLNESNLELARKYLVMSIRILKYLKYTYHDLGFLYVKLGRFRKARSYITRHYQSNPDNTEAIWAYMTILLLHGDLANGWQYIDSRFFKGWSEFFTECLTPLNSLSDVCGNVLLINEQGIGDQIMFSSFIIDLLKQRVKLSVIVEPRLCTLLSRSFPMVSFYDSTNYREIINDRQYDKIYFIASLAKYLRPDFESFPIHSGYLNVSEEKYRYYHDILVRLRGPKKLIVGIAWRSYSTHGARLRSIPLSKWNFLGQIDNTVVINLQFGDCEIEIEEFNQHAKNPLLNLSMLDLKNDLDDVAALMKSCDLIITIDNTVAHMAGALNISTWCLLPIGCDFRWFLERTDSPWYPSMHLIRQSRYGDWSDALLTVKRDLLDLVNKA